MIKETEKTMTDTTATTIPVEPGKVFALLALEGTDGTGRADWYGIEYRWVLAVRLGEAPLVLTDDGTAEPVETMLRGQLASLRRLKPFETMHWRAGIAQLWFATQPGELNVDDSPVVRTAVRAGAVFDIPVDKLTAPKSRSRVVRLR